VKLIFSSSINRDACAIRLHRDKSDLLQTATKVPSTYGVWKYGSVACEFVTTSCAVDSREGGVLGEIHGYSRRIAVSKRVYIADSSLSPFELSIEDAECFVNHESTRKFLVLKLNMSPQVVHGHPGLTVVE
jgi:hypothetical protein